MTQAIFKLTQLRGTSLYPIGFKITILNLGLSYLPI